MNVIGVRPRTASAFVKPVPTSARLSEPRPRDFVVKVILADSINPVVMVVVTNV